MKILHLIGQRPELTGSGVVLQALAKHASHSGHENFLVAGVPDHTPEKLENFPPDNCKYVRFETADLPFSVVGMSDQMPYESSRFSEMSCSDLQKYKKAFEKTLKEAVHSFQPDLIHSHHLWIVSSLAKRLFPNIPIVATCHGSDLRQKGKCGDLFEDEIKHCHKLDHIFALTKIQKKEIIDTFSIPEDHVSVIGSGYDQQLFFNENRGDLSTCEILFAGKISKSKGVLWLLKALKKNKNLSFTLHLAGGGVGSEYEACLEAAKDLDGKVQFHGVLSQVELSKLMRRSHIFILPSYFEGLPLVLLEALSSGCRIIATALPGVKEIFGKYHSDHIGLVELPELETVDTPFFKDEEKLERKLAELIERQIGRVKKNPNINLNSLRSILDPFTWENIFKSVASVYQDILEKN